MELNNSSNNYTALDSEMTEKHNSNFCHPYPSAHFETLNTAVPYVVNAALNVPSAIIAAFANSLVFFAIRRSSSIRLPSKLLFCSLVLTDLGVGLVVQPQFTMYLIIKKNQSQRTFCFLIKSVICAGTVFTCASFLTVTAMSLDRYIALFHHIKYRQTVTPGRVTMVITFIWLFSVFYASTWLWNLELYGLILILNTSICILINSVAYIKIYRRLRLRYGHQGHDTAYLQAQPQARTLTLNVEKYRKMASTVLWVYALLIFCYSPILCVCIVTRAVQHSALTECIYEFCQTLVCYNSCINPFIYCFRLPEIRTEVLKQIRKCCDRSHSQQDGNN